MPPCLDFEVVAGFYQVGTPGSSVERLARKGATLNQ